MEANRGETSCHKSGSLVLVLASGPSTCPKNTRDLTFQPFIDIMDAVPSSCFMLTVGVIKGEFGWNGNL
jgi:hypothetical protein